MLSSRTSEGIVKRSAEGERAVQGATLDRPLSWAPEACALSMNRPRSSGSTEPEVEQWRASSRWRRGQSMVAVEGKPAESSVRQRDSLTRRRGLASSSEVISGAILAILRPHLASRVDVELSAVFLSSSSSLLLPNKISTAKQQMIRTLYRVTWFDDACNTEVSGEGLCRRRKATRGDGET